MKRALMCLVVLAVSCNELKGPPNGEVQIERSAVMNSFAVGSLIIPMDNTYQNTGMFKAYGLAYKLLSNGIPVHWAIRGDKNASTAVDFSATAQNITTMASVTATYRGGPFIVDSAYATAATPIITAWIISNPSVVVHRATAAFNADVTEVLQAAPKIAVFEDDNEDIAFGVLNAAGIPDSVGNAWVSNSPDVLTAAEISGPASGGTSGDGALLRADGTPAYHFLASMHWDQPVAEVVREVRVWLDASALSHAYMQCNAVNAFENHANGRFLTNNGVGQETVTTCLLIICSTSDVDPPNPVVNRFPADVFDQYDGTLTLDTGSLQSMGLANNSTFKTGVKVLLAGGSTGNQHLAFVRGNLDGNASNGLVSYLTGHDYSTTTPMSSNPLSNGSRLMLNALFASSVAGTSGQPNLQLTKSGVALTRSTNVTWTINYTNSAGAGVADNAVIEDVLPAGTTLVSTTPASTNDGGTVTWSLGSLSPSETGSVSVTVSVAADGPYVNQAKLKYRVGVTSGSVNSNTSSTTVDTVPPNGVITTAPPARSNDSTPDFVFSSNEAGGTFECSIDNGTAFTCTAAYTLSPALSDGTHTITMTAIDAAGNRDPSPATYTWVTDTSAPDPVVITSPAAGETTSGQPTVTGTAEPGSIVAISVDGMLAATVTTDGNGAWTYTLTPAQALMNGSHNLSVTAEDAAHNISTPATRAFNVDTSVPSSPTITAPANGSFVNTPPVGINGTGVAGYTIHITIDGAAPVTVLVSGAGTWSYVPAALAEGEHTVSATQSITAGGTQSAAATSTFTIDLTKPASPVITAPTDGGVVGTSTPEVRGTAEPFSTVTLQVDGAGATYTVVADADGNWHYVLPTLTEAQHTVTATATDRAGNISTPPASVTFTVDRTAPNAPTVTGPTGITNDSTPQVTGTSDPGSTVQVFVDGVFAGNATVDGSGNWTYDVTTALGDGMHQLSASAIDPAGNASGQSTPVTVTIDTMAPGAPSVLSPAAGTATNQPSPTVSGTAEPGSTVTIKIDGNVVGQATADSTGAWSFPTTATLADGDHVVSTTATDAAGNTGAASPDVTFTVDTMAPGKPVITSPTNNQMTSGTPTFTGTAEANSLVAIIIDGQTVATVRANSSGDWLYMPGTPMADGTHVVTARATDAAGNSSPDADNVTFTSTGGVPSDGGTDGGIDDGGTGDGGTNDGGMNTDGGHGDGGTTDGGHGDGGINTDDAGSPTYQYTGGGIGCGCSAASFDFSMVAFGVLALMSRRRRQS